MSITCISLLALAACGDSSSSSRSLVSTGANVMLITLDTVRADRLALYGGPVSCPTLQSLAESGCWFEKAIADYPLTLPSHTTLLTGLSAFEHRVRDNSTFRVPLEADTLAERLKGAGFATAAFLSSYILDRRFGLAQGFDLYDDEGLAQIDATHPPERRAAATVSRARAWLEGHDRTRPFFVWIHLYDPHAPYQPPPEFVWSSSLPSTNPYDQELAYVDAMLGKFVEWARQAGKLDNTLVVVVGDHGESLGDHGEKTHGFLTYESALRVPLIMSHPLLQGRGAVAGVVGLREVMPTILAFVGVAAGESLSARENLLEAIEGTRSDGLAYFENHATWFGYGLSPIEGVVQGRWKLIHAPEVELYDLAADPGETRNLAGTEPERVALLLESLATYQASGLRLSGETRSPLTEQDRRALATLGYATAAPDIPDVAVGVGRNPRDHVAVLDRLDAIDDLMAPDPQTGERRLEQAAAAAEELVRDYPRIERARVQLCDCLFFLARVEEAVKVAQDLLQISPDHADVRQNLGLGLLRLERFADAERELRQAIADGAHSPIAHEALARALWGQERRAEAIEEVEQVLRQGALTRPEQRQLEHLRAQWLEQQKKTGSSPPGSGGSGK
ncbi:MAG: sulfatase [Planctomycetota bacterium]